MRVIAGGLVLLLVLACFGYKQQQTPEQITCGVVSGGVTVVAKGVDWAEELGSWIHDLAEKPIGPGAVKAAVEGVEKVAWYWFRTLFLKMKGLDLDPSIISLQQSAADARAAAESQCTPCPQALPQDSSPLASLGAAPVTGSPEDVARQVAARYWPADQVDTAVAIAGAESTWNPKAHNNYGAGVEGLWQINVQAHRDLVAGKDLTDPSVNAYAAHQIWLDAGRSWTPWTTYTSGSYKKFLKPSAAAKLTAAVQPQATDPTTPDPTSAAPVNPQNVGCQSSGMPAVAVATWNIYVHNAEGNVLAGMRALGKQADIIGTQENCSNAQKQAELDAMGGEFAMSAGNTCDAIFYRKAKFTLTSESSNEVFKRTDDYEGPSQGDRYINTAVLRDTLTGQTITEVNWHQIPQVQKNGKLNMAWPKRVQASRDIVGAAMTSARTHMAQGAVVVTADSNYAGDPDGSYRAAGLTQASSVFGNLKQVTRTRDIDQILFSAGPPASEHVLPAYGSDHSPRVVTFLGGNDTSPVAAVAGMRAVTDPTSHKTYSIPIPAGPRGVAVNFALDQLGKPYVFGAHGPNAYDCSGLVSAAWHKAGVDFTPQTSAMFNEVPHTSAPQEGDLTWHADGGGHTQMLLTDGLIIEAPHTGADVRIVPQWMHPTAVLDPTKMTGATA